MLYGFRAKDLCLQIVDRENHDANIADLMQMPMQKYTAVNSSELTLQSLRTVSCAKLLLKTAFYGVSGHVGRHLILIDYDSIDDHQFRHHDKTTDSDHCK